MTWVKCIFGVEYKQPSDWSCVCLEACAVWNYSFQHLRKMRRIARVEIEMSNAKQPSSTFRKRTQLRCLLGLGMLVHQLPKFSVVLSVLTFSSFPFSFFLSFVFTGYLSLWLLPAFHLFFLNSPPTVSPLYLSCSPFLYWKSHILVTHCRYAHDRAELRVWQLLRQTRN